MPCPGGHPSRDPSHNGPGVVTRHGPRHVTVASPFATRSPHCCPGNPASLPPGHTGEGQAPVPTVTLPDSGERRSSPPSCLPEPRLLWPPSGGGSRQQSRWRELANCTTNKQTPSADLELGGCPSYGAVRHQGSPAQPAGNGPFAEGHPVNYRWKPHLWIRTPRYRLGFYCDSVIYIQGDS